MKTKCGIGLILTAYAALSCSPMPIYRLRPVAEETRWLQGQELVFAEHNGVEAEVAFVRYAGRDLIFEIWIRNNSIRAFDVVPQKFYHSPLDAPQANNGARGAFNKFAVDSESSLLRIDQELARKDAGRTTAIVLDLTGAVIKVIADLATITKKKSEEEIAQEEREQQDAAEARCRRELLHETELARLRQERAYWETQALRKTTLAPRQALEGLVHFPMVEGRHAPYIKLVLPLGETELAFVFAQQKLKP